MTSERLHGSRPFQRNDPSRAHTSWAPLIATGTIGTPACRDRMVAPLRKRFTVPSIDRSPSGNSIRILPCARPKAPAFIAGTRFESGSTGTQLILRATHAMSGVSKYSTAPTKNMLASVRRGSTPQTRNAST